MNIKTARRYSDAIADVCCWLKGFQAAKPDAELPPNWRVLMELNADLCDIVNKEGEQA